MPGARELTAVVFTAAGNIAFFVLNARRPHLFYVALYNEKAHTPCMTTVIRLSRLCGWSIRCASIVLAVAFCASAFADPSENVVLPATQQPAQRTVKKLCYVVTASSAIPQPCDRLAAIPTTATPMLIIGHATTK